MYPFRKVLINWFCLGIGIVAVLAACQPAPQTVTVEVTRIVTETITTTGEPVVVTRVVEMTMEETAVPEPQQHDKDFVICGIEPDSLYRYGTGMVAAVDVFYAIYENNFTLRSYDYQAHGLENLPTLANGDARLQLVTVTDGDTVMDASGSVVTLTQGVNLRNQAGEMITFDGTPVEMPQLVVDFKMKPRVWSDGVPVTAVDSVYSYDLASHPDTGLSSFYFEGTANYEATGDLSIRWTGIPGNMDSDYFTNFMPPLPNHILSQYSPAEMFELEIASRLPVGDGPFKIVEWVAGDHILLEPNEYYYRRDEGLPKLDSVTYKFINDSNQVLAQVLAGGCDYARLSPDQLPFLLDAEANGLLVTQTSGGTIFEQISIGINSLDGYGDGVGRPDWFEDSRVRQAITMCTNRQEMVDKILYGRSQVMHTYVPESHPLFPEEIPQWPYNPDRANKLLDEAGYLDQDGDGWREDPISGKPFQIVLMTTSGTELREQITQIFQANLIDCGIDVQLEFMPATEYFAGGEEGGSLFGRQFDLGEFAWINGPEPPCDLFVSSQILGPSEEGYSGWQGLNIAGFHDERFDTACKTALSSLPGTETYMAAHQEALRIFAEELPIIPLFSRTKVAVTRPEVVNLALDPTEEELWNIFEIDLEID